MRLTGPGIWGPCSDRDEGIKLLQRAVTLGVDFIDTADAYGPWDNERLIADALHPYPDSVIIATKGGQLRPGPDQWVANSTPGHLRTAVEGSLRRLRLDCLDLYQLHAVDLETPLEDSIGALAELRHQGKIRQIGICNADVTQLTVARSVTDITSVQNLFNLTYRASADVLELCEQSNTSFIAWAPLAMGALAHATGSIRSVADRVEASPAQVALAWLLHVSSSIVPIPGASTLRELEENVAASSISLTEADLLALEEAFP